MGGPFGGTEISYQTTQERLNGAPVLSVEDFLRDFRCNLPFYHQSEKNQKYLAYSMQSPAKRVCMEKEEGESVVQLLPHGGSETARNSSDV